MRGNNIKLKKTISLILSLIMISGVFSIISFSVLKD